MLRPLGVLLVVGAVGGCSALTGLSGFDACSGAQCDAGTNAAVHPDGSLPGTPDATTGVDTGAMDGSAVVADEGGDGGTDASEEADGEDCEGGGTSVENCLGCGIPCTTDAGNAVPVCNAGI